MSQSIRVKLLRQINNLEDAIKKIDSQLDCLSHDLAYRSISKLTFDVRKDNLLMAKNKINGSIEFLTSFYEKSKGIGENESSGA